MLAKTLLMGGAVFLAIGFIASTATAATADGDDRKETILRALYDIYNKTNQPALAVQELHALIALRPNDPQLHWYLAAQLMNDRNYKAAIPELIRGSKINSGNFEFTGNLGRCYMQTANYGAAVAAYTKAVQSQRPGGTDWRGELQTAQQYVQHQIAEKRYKEEQLKRKKEDKDEGDDDD